METQKTNEFNRREYLKRVLNNFINKLGKESTSVRTNSYNGYVNLISKDKSPEHIIQNQEKLAIVKNCWDLINEPEFQQEVAAIREQLQPTTDQLLRAISNTYLERLLGDNKRKYNMAKVFSRNRFVPKTFSPKKLEPEQKRSIELPGEYGSTIRITHTGALSYKIINQDKYMEAYLIEKTLPDSTVREYKVYSYIDLNRLDSDSQEEYRDVVLNELLSTDNLELSNAGRYIGEVVDSKAPITDDNQKVQDGLISTSERVEKGFYRFQCTKNMALVFDSEKVSVARAYSKMMKAKAQKAEEARMAEQSPETQQITEIITIAPIRSIRPGQTPSDDDDEPSL